MGFTDRLMGMVAADMRKRACSQRAMAHLIGVNHSCLSRWLNDQRSLDAVSIDLVIEYLGYERVIEALRVASAVRERGQVA